MGFLDLPAQPVVASNLALASDGVPYVLIGANDVQVYQGTDGNYYFNA